MGDQDFLCTRAETPLREHYRVAGTVCSLTTNSARLFEAARGSFLKVEEPLGRVDLALRFWVDETDSSQPPWPKPYVRGTGHLVFAGFDEGSSMVADFRTGRVIGRFSTRMAADLSHWQTVIFPMLLTIVGASIGIAEMHCACVAKNKEGVLLAGPSGAGKSTLALALSQQGFGFLSDDRTFCSLESGEVQVWGLPTPLKLRPEAARWFNELQGTSLTEAGRGVPAFWLEPSQLIGVERVRECRPTSLIFLEQGGTPEFQMSPISPAEAMTRLNRELMAELPEAVAKRSRTVQKIVELPCWLLQYGGQPHMVARQIAQRLAKR